MKGSNPPTVLVIVTDPLPLPHVSFVTEAVTKKLYDADNTTYPNLTWNFSGATVTGLTAVFG